MSRKLNHIWSSYKQFGIIIVLALLLLNIVILHRARYDTSSPVNQLPDPLNPIDKQPHPPRHLPPDNDDLRAHQGPADTKDPADGVDAFVNGKPRVNFPAPAKAAPIARPQSEETYQEPDIVKGAQEEDSIVKRAKQEEQTKTADDEVAALAENGKPKKIPPKAKVAKRTHKSGGGKSVQGIKNNAAEVKSEEETSNQTKVAETSFHRNCTPEENIYMLKVHKSGSTMLQNILWRIGFARNLRMLVFPKGFPYPYLKYHESYAPPTDPHFSGIHNIMSEHSIYYPPAIAATMPKNTKLIAIIRDPLAQLRSAAEYYGIVHQLVGKSRNESSTNEVLKTFLTNPLKYEPNVVPPDMYKVRHHVINMFGYEDWKNVDNQPEFDKFMRRKDEEFFVLVLERLSESLVLLRRHMCWGIKDILSLPMRSNGSKVKNDGEDEEEEDSIEDLEMEYRTYNPGDYKAYDFFYRKITYRIDEIVDKGDFYAEVRWFDTVQAKTTAFCDKICYNLKGITDKDKYKKIVNQKSIRFAASAWDASFEVTGSDCLMMMFNPYLYRNAVKMVNYPQLCDPDKGGDKMDSRWSIPPMFCKKTDYFKYTIPWEAITDPKNYVHKCL